MRNKLLLSGWLLGMLFPLNWLRDRMPVIRRNFDFIFAPEWVHVIAHVALFAGLVILIAHTFHLKGGIKDTAVIFLVLLAVALLQETLQLPAKHRPPGWAEVFDLGIDLVGGLLGWWIVFAKKPGFLKRHGF
jgi:glycopeptide antibiotics resistance protein